MKLVLLVICFLFVSTLSTSSEIRKYLGDVASCPHQNDNRIYYNILQDEIKALFNRLENIVDTLNEIKNKQIDLEVKSVNH